jgi:hypothetical protein
VIEPAEFRMIELLTRADLAAHPVWADFHDAADRARILSWGVAPRRLEAEIERYDYCGRAPLYPVLDLAAALEVASPSVGLRIRLPDGESLPGYRVGDSAYGIYLGDDEFCLNPSLPGRAHAELERLAAALGCVPAALERLEYESVAELGASGRLRGTLEIG